MKSRKMIERGCVLASFTTVLACAAPSFAQPALTSLQQPRSSLAIVPIPCAPLGTLNRAIVPGFTSSRLTGVSDDGLFATGFGVSAAGVQELLLHNVATGATVSLGALPVGTATGPQDRISISNQAFIVGKVTGANAGTLFWTPPLGTPITVVPALPGLASISFDSITHNSLFFGGLATGANTEATAFNLANGVVTTTGVSTPPVADVTEIDHLRFGVDQFNYALVNIPGAPGDAAVSFECTPDLTVLRRPAGGPVRTQIGTCLSSDGTVAGGLTLGSGPTSIDAMVWRYGEPVVVGRLPGDSVGEMRGLNGSGLWGVGNSFGGTWQAFLFDSRGGVNTIRPLLGALANEFCIRTNGWTSLHAYDMSSNGTIVGEGVFNGVTQGFVATIQIQPFCFADLNKDGAADANDIGLYLNWLSGVELTYTGTPGQLALDVNRDGLPGDQQDIIDLIALVNAGCP